MTTATTLVPAFFRDPFIAQRLLVTPNRLEQSQAVIAQIHVNTDLLEIIADIDDASVITVILNTFYGTLTEQIEAAEGIVTSLSRQELTAVFLLRSQSQAGRIHEALVAIEQAVEAVHQQNIPGYPNIQWQVSAGVGVGMLNLAVVHNELTDRRLLLHDATAIGQAKEALGLASAGQIIVHRDVLKRLGSPPVGEWVKAQFFMPQESFTRSAVAQTVQQHRPLATPEAVDSASVAPNDLLTLIDNNLRDHVEDYQRGLLADPFVVLHVRLFDTPLLREEDLSTWQIICDRVLSTAERYGGVTVSVQQRRIELMFHAEKQLEKLAQRSISCALSIKRALQAADVDVRMTLASGKTYIGLIGSSDFKQCLLASSAVQESETLFDTSDTRDIVVTRELQTATQQEFNWRPLNEGKSFALAGEVMLGSGLVTRIQARTANKLIDRERELEQVETIISKARKGEQHLMLVTGAGGNGRSALIDMLVESWLRTDGNGFLSIGPTYSPATPYSLWIPIWQALFGLMPEANPQQNFEALDTAVSRLLPEIKNMTTLFANVLGLQDGISAQVAGLSARVRQERLLDANAQLLRYLADLTPILLVFENVDYADTLSLSLIERLPERLVGAPVLVCIEDRANPSHTLHKRFSEAMTIEARPFTTPKAWRLFRQILPRVEWPYSHARALENRLGTPEAPVQVSPGYVVSLARSLLNSVVEADNTFNEEHPPQNWPRSRAEGVQLLFGAGISPEARQVAMRASAAGMMFYHHWPWLEATQIELEVEQLRAQEMVEPFIDLGHLQRWDHFRSNTTREAVYEYLDIGTRLRLHRQIAEWYQRLIPGRSGKAFAAFQLQQGGRFLPAIRAHLEASRHAADWGAESEAAQHLLAAERLTVQRDEHSAERCRIFLDWGRMRIKQGHYERALKDIDLAARLADDLSDTGLIGEALVLRSHARYLAGQLDAALQDATTSANLTMPNKVVTARALWLQALILFEQGKRRQAARTLTHALNLNTLQDPAMQIEMELDAARIMLADYQRDAARTYVTRAQRRARELADSILLHRVLKVQGHILLLYGEADLAIETLEQALSLPPPPDTGIAELGDILLDYAVALCYLGRYVDAESAFETAAGYFMGEDDFEARERTLNVLRITELLIDRGQLDEAKTLIDDLLAQREALSAHMLTLLELTNVDILIRRKALDQARQVLDGLAAVPTSGVKLWFTPLRLMREAELALAQGDYDQADQLAVRALGAVSLQGDQRVLTTTYSLIAEAKMLRRDRAAAVQDALERAVRNGRKQGRRVHLARALDLLGNFLRTTSLRGSTRARSNSYLFEANMLFQEMNLSMEMFSADYMQAYWDKFNKKDDEDAS